MKKTAKLLIVYLFVIITMAIVIQMYSHFSGAFVQTEVLRYETLEIGDTSDCYFSRFEEVHVAPYSGQINYYLEDSIKVRKGSAILDISAGAVEGETGRYDELMKRLKAVDAVKSELITENNGIVSYYMDGYENFFNPLNLKELKYKDVNEMPIKIENLARKDSFKGEPLFKIVRDDEWYIVTWIKPAGIVNYEIGKKANIVFGKNDIQASIESITEDGEMWQVVLKTTRYCKDFAKNRRVRAKIITQDYSGVKVRNSSIVNENGVAGVYIRNKTGDLVFKPIKIYMSDGEYSIVADSAFIDKDGKEVLTVRVYDELVKNPKRKDVK